MIGFVVVKGTQDVLSLCYAFAEIVRMKYPRTPIRAYKLAKRGANQGGLDFARDHEIEDDEAEEGPSEEGPSNA